MSNEYPKWVQRAPHIGAVLCLNRAEEEKLLEDWELEQLEKAEKATAAAEAEAAAARASAQVNIQTAEDDEEEEIPQSNQSQGRRRR